VSFATALALVLLVALFVMAATMANLLARITRLERFANEVLTGTGAAGGAVGPGGPAPVRMGGLAAPEPVLALVKGHAEAQIILLSPDCTACEDAVVAVTRWPEDVRRATTLAYRAEPADDFVAPAGVRVAPGAHEVFEALAVRSTPVIVRVRDGIIVERSTGAIGALANGSAPENVDGALR
jgi:hypothetical protein